MSKVKLSKEDLLNLLFANKEQTITANKILSDKVSLRTPTGSLLITNNASISVGNVQEYMNISGIGQRPMYWYPQGGSFMALTSDLNNVSVCPQQQIENISFATGEIYQGRVIYTATKNCVCSFRIATTSGVYLNFDLFNSIGAFCYSFSLQVEANDTQSIVFPMSVGMYIQCTQASKQPEINWCNLQICGVKEI